MAIVRLSETSDWELEYPDQDLRGQSILDADGRPVGQVVDLWIDEVTEQVARLELDNGTQLWMSQLGRRGDQVVCVSGPPHDNFARTGDQISQRHLPEGEIMRSTETLKVRPKRPENLFADQLAAAAHGDTATPIFEQGEDAAPDRHLR